MMLSEGSDWGERLKKESNSSLLQFYPGKVPVQAGNRGGRGAVLCLYRREVIRAEMTSN